jgi:glucokinase
MSLFAAVDVGGTKTRIEVFSASEEPLRTRILDTPRSGDVAGDMAQAISEATGGGLASVGVGCPGPLDPLEGVVLNPPNLSRRWWGLGLPTRLGERLCCPVALENDCNLGALGEALYGGGRGYGSTLYITVSTGVGGGLVVDGHIFGGTRGFAVEIGHTKVTEKAYLCGCGREGCVEAVASGTAIARRAREAGWVAPDDVALSASSVASAAQEGDWTAFEVLREAARYLATAIVNYVYSYDPAIVLIGGGVAQSDLFMELVREAVDAEPIMPAFRGTPVRRADLGERSVVYGALALARRAPEPSDEAGGRQPDPPVSPYAGRAKSRFPSGSGRAAPGH